MSEALEKKYEQLEIDEKGCPVCESDNVEETTRKLGGKSKEEHGREVSALNCSDCSWETLCLTDDSSLNPGGSGEE